MNKLALKYGLSRHTCSVTRKGEEVVIIEEISDGKEDGRKETYYFFAKSGVPDHLNAVLVKSKDRATRFFLGLEATGVSEPTEPKDDGVSDSNKEIDKKKPAKKATKKKAAAKKSAAKEEVADEAPELVTDEAMDLGDDFPDEEEKEEEVAIMYNKGDREHAAHLRPLLVKNFGKDWKKDSDKVGQVRELIGKLNGKVAVMTPDGEVCSSFEGVVEALLK